MVLYLKERMINMGMILNVHDQVDKVINEIERNYSKGLTFYIK